MSINIILKLPADIQEDVSIKPSSNIQSLKYMIEKKYGIPCELQKIEFNGVCMKHEDVLGSRGVTECSEIIVNVDIWWTKLVSLCLRGNNVTLYRRVSVTMQQTTEINRAFITLFVSATRGFDKNVSCLLFNYRSFDLKLATKITGRTLLHAAISSGNLQCLESIKKHAGMNFERLLYTKDKRGVSAIDELTLQNECMINYINKFVSKVITPEDILKKNLSGFQNYRKDKNIDIDVCLNNVETINNTGDTVRINELENLAEESIKEDSNILVNRQKQDNPLMNLKLTDPSYVTKASDNENKKSPILDHTTETITDFYKKEPSKINGPITPPLPAIKDYSPVVSVGNIIPAPPSSPRPRVKQPRPKTAGSISTSPRHRQHQCADTLIVPTFEKKSTPDSSKKTVPVAGVLRDTNSRKFSAARKQIILNNGLLLPSAPLVFRAKSVEPASNNATLNPPQIQERPLSAGNTGKVRRISVLQKPTSNLQAPGRKVSEAVDDLVVITMEEDRIEKPWNSWIKAVTVDAESEEGKDLLISAPVERTRKISSIQTTVHDEDHKKSFDDWCRYKAQEQLIQQGKMEEAKNEKERQDIAVRYNKNGKNFEQWMKEKQLYEVLLKQQQREDERGNRKPRKLLKGKTFEEWQKEIEEKERCHNDQKKIQKVKENEQQAKKEKRRKESSAKYDQWLAEKEKQDMERDLKEFQSLVKRKQSTTKQPESMTKNRKKSVKY